MSNTVGKISGQMLENNLVRRDMQTGDENLSFETDLLYLDVFNKRVGINNDTPFRQLVVDSDIRTTNLIVDNLFTFPNFEISSNVITNTDGDILIESPTTIGAGGLATEGILIDVGFIRSRRSNEDIDLIPAGSGNILFYSNVEVNGNLHATGDVTFDGSFTIGDSDADSVTFAADIAGNLIPDADLTYSIGSSTKKFSELGTSLINGQDINSTATSVAGVDLSVRPGNIYFVAENGDNAFTGDHENGPFRTIAYALSQATSGDTVFVYPGVYMEYWPLVIPEGVTLKGSGLRATKIIPQAATNDYDAIHLNGQTTVSDLTISNFFYNNVANTGYAFRFANNLNVSSRSPYMQNISVITENESSLASAGRGAYIDGSVANPASKEASMLFHSATFITPGADCIIMKNGVRVEWLNSFIYYANKGLLAENGSLGFAGLGNKFGAEVRSIGSANVYGNYGVWADGDETLMYLINHNFGYIGSGTDSNNDPTDAIQANETIELNDGKIYYQSVDHKGDFRVGDQLLIESSTGSVTFTSTNVTANNLTVTDGTNTSYADAQQVSTGNITFTNNTIQSTVGGINLNPFNTTLNITSDFFGESLTGNNNLTVDNSTTFGNSGTDIATVNARINSDLIPDNSSYELGASSNKWRTLFGASLFFEDIRIDTNTITTTLSNSDLELAANGTGVVRISDNFRLDQNLSISGTTNLQNTTVNGITSVTGFLNVTNTFQAAGYQTDDIVFDDNYITTTLSNSSLEFRADGTGGVTVDQTLRFTNGTLSNVLLAGTESQRSIIFSPYSNESIIINSSTALTLPLGNNTNRVLSSSGEIRFNNLSNTFEGRVSGGFRNFYGLFDSDNNTGITAESSLGANDNTIRMLVNGVSQATITSQSLTINNSLRVDELILNSNIISTFNSNADLELDRSGSGVVQFKDNFTIVNNIFTNINNNAETQIVSTGTGYVRFVGNKALQIPAGTEAEKPVGIPVGSTRWNTDLGYLEVYDGSAWVISTGGGAAITAGEMEDIADEWILIFG